MWDIVWVSPQGHRSVSVSRRFLLQAPQCPCSVRKRFSRDHCCRGRSKPGCRIVGSPGFDFPSATVVSAEQWALCTEYYWSTISVTVVFSPLYHHETSAVFSDITNSEQKIVTYTNEAEVMWSFCLSFCKQDNWLTRKQASTKLGRHGQRVTL